MEYAINAEKNADVQKIYDTIMQIDNNTIDDSNVDYKPLYLCLFNHISDIAENLKDALESNDSGLLARAALQTIAALWGAQSEAEKLLLSQTEEATTLVQVLHNSSD